MSEHTYGDAGVHLELGNDVSKILFNAAKLTWVNRAGKLGEVVKPKDSFRGLRYIRIGGLPDDIVMYGNADGVGTKSEVAERVRDYRTMAYDLLAMVCDDAVLRGAEPAVVMTILNVRALRDQAPYLEQVRQLAEGYVAAANDANVAIINGEVAELGSRVGGYGDFNCNWDATVTWFAREDRLLSGDEVKEGDVLVGLRECGFRSNGLSLVRRILASEVGEDWHERPFGETTYGRAVLTPSRIYTRAIVDMFGGVFGQPKAEVHGVAHITGGGIPEKLGSLLEPSGLGALIDDPFDPPEIMARVLELGNVRAREAYRAFNMGQGMIVASPDPDSVVEVADDYGIEARTIGVVRRDPCIAIMSETYGIQTFDHP